MVEARYLVRDERKMRLALVVDVVEDANAAALDAVKRKMVASGCAHALVIDPQKTHVLRDTFRDMTEASVQEEAVLDTTLLGGPAGSLDRRVQRWLETMASNWQEGLPKDPTAAVLLYDVVPALLGADVQRLEPDAA